MSIVHDQLRFPEGPYITFCMYALEHFI